MLFNLFSKTPTQQELELKESKEEVVERMVKNFERRISLMNFSIQEFKEDRDAAIEKGLIEVAAKNEANIKFFQERLEEIRKEFQKEILELIV